MRNNTEAQPRDLASLYSAPVPVYTHVVEYNGGTSITEIGYADVRRFARPLHGFNGSDRFALTLWALPDGMNYEKARATGRDALAYLQAGGSADTLTLDVRKAGGSEWGADWVRYVVGHLPAEEHPSLVVPIPLPRGPEIVAQNEVFGADEAAAVFYSYFKTGHIPGEYSLRPVEGYTKDGGLIDLRDKFSKPV